MARLPALLSAISTLLWAGCSSLPVSFSPPPQQISLASSGHFVMMGAPDADRYIVQGFAPQSEGLWRWAYDHPVLRFVLPSSRPLRFTMDFSFPEATFAATGPVTLAISINGRSFDTVRYGQPNGHTYARDVPAALLNAGENLVSIEPDRTATPQHLGFVVSRAGFTE